ncbi:DNA-processing protein DprA [Methylomagnum ishizawai]|uniref:DNA-processing protein DprA n=1 Tax=Methylomagnum ishizawai TaxID=1760988 RepID=UPI001C33CBBA|nr:DNA-processing protein DprA [Methylomagnum ishizawai]BBL76527.1 DNA processing protein DprA [Methylomagnum ishizawai]
MAGHSGSDLRYWLALHRAPLIGSRRFASLLSHFGTPKAVFEAGTAAWTALKIPEKTIAYFQNPDWGTVAHDLDWLNGSQRHCLTLHDPRYPALLREIADPPPLLFVVGEPAALASRQVAMVGSRNPSASGRKAAHHLARELAAAGYGVVSGLALGIDAAAHRGALDGNGITLAVAGTGPDQIYPRQHRALAQEIVERGGAILSEFPPGTEPKAGNFPRRNRIISGLALGTLVVEAAEQSGSLITARLALEQGREVFAVPGSIYSPVSKGCNDLIQEGAKLVQSVRDIVEEFGPTTLPGRPEPPPLPAPSGDEPHWALLKFIAYDPTSVDTLVAVTGESPESIAATLLMLELQGYVESAPGGCYVRIK